MVTIQLRDVPQDVVVELVRQAEAAGVTLNQLILEHLRVGVRIEELRRDDEASRGSGDNAEVFARAHARPGKVPPPGWATKEIRRMRDAVAGDL